MILEGFPVHIFYLFELSVMLNLLSIASFLESCFIDQIFFQLEIANSILMVLEGIHYLRYFIALVLQQLQ
jgi:hypothetical protein